VRIFGFTDWLYLFLILCLLERTILLGAISCVVSDDLGLSSQKRMIMCKKVGLSVFFVRRFRLFRILCKMFQVFGRRSVLSQAAYSWVYSDKSLAFCACFKIFWFFSVDSHMSARYRANNSLHPTPIPRADRVDTLSWRSCVKWLFCTRCPAWVSL